jgi:NACHT domain
VQPNEEAEDMMRRAVYEHRARDRVDLDRLADDLATAVQQQWQDEEDRRRIRDPVPLPVRWRPAPPHLADHVANAVGAPAGAYMEPSQLRGRIEQVADAYRRVPSGRMVFLGAAGSGKTVLTSRLTLGLLATRRPGDVVPVVVSVGTWNPNTSLRRWLAGQLARDYAGLARAPARGAPSLATGMVDAGLILPVLDGFDEIPQELQSAALAALNAVVGMPLVLTSRVDEYAAAVATTGVLAGAAVVQLDELSVADLAGYLARTGGPGAGRACARWDPVIARLRAQADGADDPAAAIVGAVLSTPLMVFLARTAYSDTPGHDPASLLDTLRYPDADAVEHHLLAAFVPAVYRPASPTTGRDWQADRAWAWLAFLARHLRRQGTRDLAWWRLRDSVPGPARVFAGALASGLGLGLQGVLAFGLVGGITLGPGRGLRLGLAAGLVLGLVGVLWGGLLSRRGPVPVRSPTQATGRAAGVLRMLGYGLLGCVAGGLVGATAGAFVPDIAGGLAPGFGYGLIGGTAAGLAAGLALGLSAPVGVTATVHLRASLAADRGAAVVRALAVGMAFILAGGLATGLATGFAVVRALGLAAGLAVLVSARLVGGFAAGLAIGLPATAWGQWLVLVRFWLPLAGRLPWPLVGFLDDAHRRGVLRRAGAVYQFRHARLQDHLAGGVSARTRPAGPRRSQPSGARSSGHTDLVRHRAISSREHVT